MKLMLRGARAVLVAGDKGTFYIGSTGDLERRIFEHKEGRST